MHRCQQVIITNLFLFISLAYKDNVICVRYLVIRVISFYNAGIRVKSLSSIGKDKGIFKNHISVINSLKVTR
jgi:hypothetical protein